MNDNIFFAAASILLKVSIDIVRVARKNIVLFFSCNYYHLIIFAPV